MRAMARDFGMDMEAWLWVDASAAIGIARRKGLGKVRHVAAQSLWVQDSVRERRINLHKVPGQPNPSDSATKFLDGNTMNKHLEFMHVCKRERASINCLRSCTTST